MLQCYNITMLQLATPAFNMKLYRVHIVELEVLATHALSWAISSGQPSLQQSRIEILDGAVKPPERSQQSLIWAN